ncbi:MAG: hypothetical protein K2M46_10525 [Lachnospiraceae bacterium]|nr:hypothetical protein [Lachnospiraceae bacterium]
MIGGRILKNNLPHLKEFRRIKGTVRGVINFTKIEKMRFFEKENLKGWQIVAVIDYLKDIAYGFKNNKCKVEVYTVEGTNRQLEEIKEELKSDTLSIQEIKKKVAENEAAIQNLESRVEAINIDLGVRIEQLKKQLNGNIEG